MFALKPSLDHKYLLYTIFLHISLCLMSNISKLTIKDENLASFGTNLASVGLKYLWV